MNVSPNIRIVRITAVLALFVPMMAALAGKPPQSSSQSPTTSPKLDSNSQPPQAATLYRRNCLGCHGQDGSGSKARRSMTEIPDFTDPDWHAEKSDFRLAASIHDGKGTHMPAFADILGDAEIRKLVTYVRSLDPPAKVRQPAGKSGSGTGQQGDFEKRFRMLQDELKSLREQFERISQSASRK